MSSADIENKLHISLDNELKKSEFSNQSFMPDGQAESILGEDGILAEILSEKRKSLGTVNNSMYKRIRTCIHLIFRQIHRKKSGKPTSDSPDSGLVEYIADHATRVFAILVYSGHIEKALTLRRHGFMDKYLPIQMYDRQATTFHLLMDDKALKWFEGWSQQELGSFIHEQWRFLAPVFTRRSILEQPHDDCPLPFTSYGGKQDAEGGYGTIRRAIIHNKHIHGFRMDADFAVAIKRLHNLNIPDRAYEIEMDALELARHLNHDHLVQFIAGFEVTGQQYLMFQWVDGGNLRDLWKNHPWDRSEDLIRWALGQMKGIAEGLKELHGVNPQKNCRHGDLKPENILVSKKPSGGPIQGTLQIADMGSAKIHTDATALRHIGTTSLAGTFRYQPPEVQANNSGKRSRAYDIWSMGCILLEFIVWLLYGPEGLGEFVNSFVAETQPFFLANREHFCLQPHVDEWITHIRTKCLGDNDDCVSRALKDLLDFVYTQILVMSDEAENIAGSTHESSTTQGQQTGQQRRANISRVVEKLMCILSNQESNYFYNKEASGITASRDTLNGEELKRKWGPGLNQPPYRVVGRQQQVANSENPYPVLSLSDSWEFCNDNIFARNFFRTLTSKDMESDFPEAPTVQVGKLCSNCENLFSNTFSFTLDNATSGCKLCEVLMLYLGSHGQADNAKLVRVGSSLTTASTKAPILSIFIRPGYSNVPSHIQRGFPYLAMPKSATRYRLFRHWLNDCDNNHGKTCGRPTIEMRDPTRLIYVGTSQKDLALRDSNPLRHEKGEGKRYVALSHIWGTKKIRCTTSSNVECLKKSIDYNWLSKNFQDAVTVTRNLGIKYLWIDSLCIVQKKDKDLGDFHVESKFMEDYYGGAYCTIAASSAGGSYAGFLEGQPATEDVARTCHGLQGNNNTFGPESTFYICNTIDDFARDVEDSRISKRGWVFQERALSRRTIHFTDKQAYWECGHGVRCETMNRLFNRKSSFLSDANFPDSTTEFFKGMKIEFFQYIYSRYSNLDFSHETDRSVAMLGLEKRLERVYSRDSYTNVHAKFGIIDHPFLHRSLLWQRADPTSPLRKIGYKDNQKVPSWSWMAVMGPIEYMDAPFEMMEWNHDINSPFQDTPKNVDTELASDYIVPATEVLEVDSKKPIYDRSNETDKEGRWVVIGWEKTEGEGGGLNLYALLIKPTGETRGGYADYERIGVTCMTVKDDKIKAALKKGGTKVRIV